MYSYYFCSFLANTSLAFTASLGEHDTHRDGKNDVLPLLQTQLSRRWWSPRRLCCIKTGSLESGAEPIHSVLRVALHPHQRLKASMDALRRHDRSDLSDLPLHEV